MVNINHAPHFDTDKVIEHYSLKDGVPVKYVCTSALGDEAESMDIFYRDTPHPEFGNRYFGLYKSLLTNDVMITNADAIDGIEFAMIKDRDGKYWYSSHRHDCLFIDGNMIDGGRAYVRSQGNVDYFKLKDGMFVHVQTS